MAYRLPMPSAVETAFAIFLNPGSGRGAATESEALQKAFAAAGAQVDVRITPPRQLEAAIARMAQNGAAIVGAAGGDGTISAAANALAGTKTTLLPIPLGTLNHFSNRYGIGTLEASVEAYSRGHAADIHVGAVNGRVFVNNASCGFYPHVVRHRERLERLLPRLPAMWIASLGVLAALPMMKLDIDIHGGCKQLRTPALWVGIGRNSLRRPIPGDADVEGNVLEIVAGRADRRRSVVRLATRLLWHLSKGIEPRAPNLVVERSARFTLHSRHAIDIALDGEPYRMKAPLRFELRQNALGIFCLVAPSA